MCLPIPAHSFVQGLSPSRLLPQTSLNLFNLDLTVQGFPRYVHYVASIVTMRAVGILLKCLLVPFNFSSETTITMASITPYQSKICKDCAEAFKKNKCLLTAIEFGHHECLEVLLKTGADVNSWCRSPPSLMFYPHCKCSKMFIAIADVNKQDDQNYTPLMHAARHRQSESTKVLLPARADVNRQNHFGDTALMEASHSNALQCMQILIPTGADVNKQNHNGERALMKTGRSNSIQCMETLIQAGADVNTRSQSGETALLVAAASSHFDCVEILMRAGADVNIQNHRHHFALLFAAHGGNVKWTEKLILTGADVNKQSEDGGTAIIDAAACGHHKCIDFLIQAGADVNIMNNSGWTALHVASFNGCDDKCMDTLINVINVNLKDGSGSNDGP